MNKLFIDVRMDKQISDIPTQGNNHWTPSIQAKLKLSIMHIHAYLEESCSLTLLSEANIISIFFKNSDSYSCADPY